MKIAYFASRFSIKRNDRNVSLSLFLGKALFIVFCEVF